MIGTTRIPNTPHSEIRVIEPEVRVESGQQKPRRNKKILHFTSSSQPGYVVPGRIVHFRALYIIRIMILMVVKVFMATMLVVVIVMFGDESLRGALVDVEVRVWALRLLSNSNRCQTNHTTERTELHTF